LVWENIPPTQQKGEEIKEENVSEKEERGKIKRHEK
jgi:hypothetical protein